ncbi:TonB-dependent receptor [Mucilaginibacter sp. RS28]|uniref:TonB-dependent receptor n=1 Tax=Mucilaginibacter straminoryzae TaxID=2932774 RepID=A0A9X2B7U2_9SPHI|nr:TonB-dependent receptor [Mucilaginibacter straminoryzae]MCJ8208949.1 TonB-dependent receptor [Mucilaginibacter straminoryzae]
MQKKITLFFAFLLSAAWAFAQDITVKGVVKDPTGQTLPGVSVRVKGATTGIATDVNGNYSITTGPQNTLVFSFIGMATQEQPIAGRTTINVTLANANTALNEVVVVGYGTQRKGDITGAIAVVGKKDLDARPNTQFGNLIEGKTAGVQVVSPSGSPTSTLNIKIRGANSITAGSSPLYVVDGVPTTDTRSLNPADIENISILKDASSAAIYGAQGANGVVLITTKRGTGKPRVDFSGYTGFSSVRKRLDVLNADQYRDLVTSMGYTTDWSQYTNNTNWQDEIFRNGISQNYQLAVSGKSDGTTYYISGGWTQQKGVIRSSQMQRYNFKVNLEQKVNNWFTVGTNLTYTNYNDVSITDNANVNSGGVLLGALTTPPNIGVFNANSTYTANPFQEWENPLASLYGSTRPYKNQRLLGNAYGEIKFTKDLKFRSSIGTDYSNAVSNYFLDPYLTSYGRQNKGISRNQTYLTNYWISDNTLTYDKKIDKHSFNVLAGYVYQKFRYENGYIQATGFSSNNIPTTNAGSTITANNTIAERANMSALGRINYDYAGKYLLTANFRADGSSVFGPGKRWGYFPSFSAGWRLSEESFLKDVEAINDLKLRAGWGIVGNDQIDPYSYLGRISSGSNYVIGGSVQPGNYPSSVENRNLKWEQTKQTNIGIDLSLLNSRLNFTADVYEKNTSDLLLNLPLPRSTGFDIATVNAGKLRNRGIEFMVSSVNVKKTDFTWNTDFNISFNRNKVMSIVGQQIYAGGISGRDNVSIVQEGQPLGMFYGYVAAGVDPATGNELYRTASGGTTATPSAADRTIIGNPNPDFIYGLTNTLTYKNFSLNIFFQGSQGNDIFNATRIETEGMTGPQNQSTAVLRRWTAPGQVTDVPRASRDNINNSLISTRFVENGSYLRLRTATLGYTLPKTLLTKLHVSNVRLYVTGENLLTFTKYSGFDPEVNAFVTNNNLSNNGAIGIDYGTYPQTRNLIFGLNVSF